MRHLIVRFQARLDVADFSDYIADSNPAIAAEFPRRATARYADLLEHPHSGHIREEISRLANIWSIHIPRFRNHLILYRPTDEAVEILRVVHGMRDLKGLLRELERELEAEDDVREPGGDA